jgi:hypothetical protein
MATVHTYLAPGQRYTEAGQATWCADRQLTVLQVGSDHCGLPCMVCRVSHGHRLVFPAAQF